MLLKDIINNLDEDGFSLLHLNAKEGNAENVKKLIDRGANIEIKDKQHTSSPLLWALQNGHSKVVDILLQSGADKKAMNFYGTTALHFAAQSGQFELVEMLVKQGLDVNAKDNGDETPLHDACRI